MGGGGKQTGRAGQWEWKVKRKRKKTRQTHNILLCACFHSLCLFNPGSFFGLFPVTFIFFFDIVSSCTQTNPKIYHLQYHFCSKFHSTSDGIIRTIFFFSEPASYLHCLIVPLVLSLEGSEQLIAIHHFHASHDFTDIYHTPFKFNVLQFKEDFSLLSCSLPLPVLVDFLWTSSFSLDVQLEGLTIYRFTA